jgi:hypothetical protein
MGISVSGISSLIVSAASSEFASFAAGRLQPYGPRQTSGPSFPAFSVNVPGGGMYGPDGKLARINGEGLSFIARA